MQQNEITSLIKTVFETDKGEKLLKHLQLLVDRPMYKKGLTLDEVAFREGQADFVRQIMKEVSYGR